MRHRSSLLAAALVALAWPGFTHAGVVNPDISLIGQPVATWSDDPRDIRNYRRLNLSAGETEIVFDSALNPYARGFATLSLADGKADVEEAFFTILRGLPGGIEVKGGKYRVGFGKLNTAHPHTYPFVERFRVLKTFLPGEDSFNDAGVDVSGRIPVPGDIALTASADILQGDSFQNGDTTTTRGVARQHNAFLGRLTAFVPIGDRSGLELGTSASQGVNDVFADARTMLVGADAKLKLWTSDNANLLVQGEFIHRDLEGTSDTPGFTHLRTSGMYAFANYSWAMRYNAGLSYERYATLESVPSDQAVGAFAGLALMEETTWFRLAYEHFTPGQPAGAPAVTATNTVRLGIIFSMGPHKAHQF